MQLLWPLQTKTHSLTYVHVRTSQQKLKHCKHTDFEYRKTHGMYIVSFNTQLYSHLTLKTSQSGMEIYEKTLPKSEHPLSNIFFAIKISYSMMAQSRLLFLWSFIYTSKMAEFAYGVINLTCVFWSILTRMQIINTF